MVLLLEDLREGPSGLLTDHIDTSLQLSGTITCMRKLKKVGSRGKQ